MYVSVNNCFELDKVIKSFEVAYRSFIVTEIKSKYPDLNSFSIAINKIDGSINASSLLLSHKYKARITKTKKEISAYYKRIEECHQTFVSKSYNNDVPNVSEIIDYVIFFFNDFFKDLANEFSSIEEFSSLNVTYSQVRNALSHPASSKIKIEDCKHTLNFIKKVSINISPSYYWYVSHNQLHEWIEDLYVSLDTLSLRYHNLSDVAFSHHELFEREDELMELRNLIFGKDVGYRKSGSVVVYGYGGVGKTALILEFLYRVIKEINDKSLNEPLDFVLFFTSKEELLSYSETTKKLYIQDIRKQITSFEDFENRLAETFHYTNGDDLNKLKGLIVIDNFETLQDSEKDRFFDYIKRSSRTIQFILTSRNEERCEDKMNLKEFSDDQKGLNFMSKYVSALSLNQKLSTSEFKRLINLSKGNTLIIVLSLQLISENYSIDNIFNDLQSVESKNIEIISDFMYKNTIGQAIDYLKNKNHNPISILKVISLYDVPVDLYSLSKIADVSVNSTEICCEFLATKLILEKNGETYKTNDFANKFIISKYLPNRIELKRLKQMIKDHQKLLANKLKTLELARKNEPMLNGIMNDWKPKNSIDKIAISEAYGLFNRSNDPIIKVGSLEREFENIEKMTSHPYIRFQKARCFQRLLKKSSSIDEQAELKVKISNYFEEAIDSTDFYYPYIKNTKSYASINWLYGLFLSSIIKDYSKALRYLEDAVFIFKRLRIKDKAYFTAINNLSWVYKKLFEVEDDILYLIELAPLYKEVRDNKNSLRGMDFDYALYLRNFSTVVARVSN